MYNDEGEPVVLKKQLSVQPPSANPQYYYPRAFSVKPSGSTAAAGDDEAKNGDVELELRGAEEHRQFAQLDEGTPPCCFSMGESICNNKCLTCMTMCLWGLAIAGILLFKKSSLATQTAVAIPFGVIGWLYFILFIFFAGLCCLCDTDGGPCVTDRVRLRCIHAYYSSSFDVHSLVFFLSNYCISCVSPFDLMLFFLFLSLPLALSAMQVHEFVHSDIRTTKDVLNTCETLAGATPVLTVFVNSYHTKTSGSGKRRRTRRVVTYEEKISIPVLKHQDVGVSPGAFVEMINMWPSEYSWLEYDSDFRLSKEQIDWFEKLKTDLHGRNKHRDKSCTVWHKYTMQTPTSNANSNSGSDVHHHAHSVIRDNASCTCRYFWARFFINRCCLWLSIYSTLYLPYICLWKCLVRQFRFTSLKFLVLDTTVCGAADVPADNNSNDNNNNDYKQ